MEENNERSVRKGTILTAINARIWLMQSFGCRELSEKTDVNLLCPVACKRIEKTDTLIRRIASLFGRHRQSIEILTR